jgi:hypothetical protein
LFKSLINFESFKRGGQLKTHLSRKHTNQKDEAQVIQKDGLLQFIYKDDVLKIRHFL